MELNKIFGYFFHEVEPNLIEQSAHFCYLLIQSEEPPSADGERALVHLGRILLPSDDKTVSPAAAAANFPGQLPAASLKSFRSSPPGITEGLQNTASHQRHAELSERNRR